MVLSAQIGRGVLKRLFEWLAFIIHHASHFLMADSTLKRTLRRCTAVLTIPVSLYPMVFVARLETDGYPYMNLVLDLADEISLLLLLGAVVYLIGSVILQLWRSQPEHGREQTASQTG